jgi:exosortase/archaeosortase family protein
MLNALSEYIDLRFFLKFLFTFSFLFFFHQFFIGISTPGNLYVPFIDDHLNYVKWIISGVLHTSALLVQLSGLHPIVNGNFMTVPNGASIDMGWACAGLGIISFWIAFVTAHPLNIKKKISWVMAGIASIFLLNCLRISLLLFALQHHWKESIYASHHDIFNYASFIFIFLMTIFFVKSIKISTDAQDPQLTIEN